MVLFLASVPAAVGAASGTDFKAARISGTGTTTMEAGSPMVLVQLSDEPSLRLELSAGMLHVDEREERVADAQGAPQAGRFQSSGRDFQGPVVVRLTGVRGEDAAVLLLPSAGPQGGRGSAELRGSFEARHNGSSVVHHAHPRGQPDVEVERTPTIDYRSREGPGVRTEGSSEIRLRGAFRLHVWAAALEAVHRDGTTGLVTGRESLAPAGGAEVTTFRSAVLVVEDGSLTVSADSLRSEWFVDDIRLNHTGPLRLEDATGSVRDLRGPHPLRADDANLTDGTFALRSIEGVLGVRQERPARALSVDASGPVAESPMGAPPADLPGAGVAGAGAEEGAAGVGLPVPSLWTSWMPAFLAVGLLLGAMLVQGPVRGWLTERTLEPDRLLQWESGRWDRLSVQFRRRALAFENRGRYRGALRNIGYALRWSPHDPQLHLMRALYLGALGRHDDALEEHRLAHQGFRATPEEPEFAHNGLEAARSAVLLGNDLQALYWLKIALTADPGLSDYVEKDPDFAILQGLPEFRWMMEAGVRDRPDWLKT